MFLKFRNSRKARYVALTMVASLVGEVLLPTVSYALTGGPSTPESGSFTPIEATELVDPFTGDFNYSIPLLDVGGYPLNLGYSGNVNMEQEASWVGLGWNINPGAINRQMRGLPDDFQGDHIVEEFSMRPNQTFTSSFSFGGELYGYDNLGFNLDMGFKINNYDGLGIISGGGLKLSATDGSGATGSLGLQFTNSPDGLDVNPSVGFSQKVSGAVGKSDAFASGSLSIGAAFNSRQGLKAINMSASVSGGPQKPHFNEDKGKWGTREGGFGLATGGSLSFVDNTYVPSYQFPKENVSLSGKFKLGGAVYGNDIDFSFLGAFSSQGFATNTRATQAYGYLHEEDAVGRDDALMDFNREKQRAFSRTMPFLHTTTHTFDLFKIAGQGVGGMFRAFRNEAGYVHDPRVKDITGGGRAGVEWNGGSTIDFGVNAGVNIQEGESGVWASDNDALGQLDYKPKTVNDLFEPYYFRNVGESSVDATMQGGNSYFERNGGFDPVRIDVDVNGYESYARSRYVDKAAQTYDLGAISARTDRAKRNQVISAFTREEVQALRPQQYVSTHAADHHLSQLNIIRNDGQRYIYDVPAYNLQQNEVSFNISGRRETADSQTGLVSYQPGYDNTTSNQQGRDWFYHRITTPAYAHSYLLGSVLSPDYIDSDGVPGPSPDDYGSYTKFDYGIENSNGQRLPDVANYGWRTPYQKDQANYSEGMKVDFGDDRANYVYGVKELWYIHKVESKTHVALFHLSNREDGYGVADENGGRGSLTTKKLDSISLYARPDYEAMIADPAHRADPIKKVHFEYNYSLCPDVPNNINTGANNGKLTGKLTLKRVWFTYSNSYKGELNDYQFAYGDTDHDGTTDVNPAYNMKAMTPWGTYQQNNATVTNRVADPITNQEFPYVNQNLAEQDLNANSWLLTTIYMPSGGRIDVDFESKDYAYVQDKAALRMFKLEGTTPLAPGSVTDVATLESKLYQGAQIHRTVFFEVPDNLTPDQEDDIFNPLADKEDMYFRVLADLTSSWGDADDGSYEYVEGYLADAHIVDGSWGVKTLTTPGGNKRFGYFQVEGVPIKNDVVGPGNPASENPIAKAIWQFGRMNAPRRVFDQPDPQDGNALLDVLKALGSQFQNLVEFFTGPNGRLKAKEYGRDIIPSKSWVRLQEPTQHKLGGGSRVRRVEMHDNWELMSGQSNNNFDDDFSYGQEYIYELADGSSSGVATYEPMGTKENPLIKPFSYSTEHLLAPNDNHYVEAPFGEAFHPGASVGHSRVIVKNLSRFDQNNNPISLNRHGVGHNEYQFYTARDYPTRVDYTDIYAREKKASLGEQLLKVNIRNYATASQGFVIETNDMHGKPRGHYVYAEGQTDYQSGVTYLYDHNPATIGTTGYDLFETFERNQTKLNNEVQVITPTGDIKPRQIGVDFDIINDFSESKSQVIDVGVQVNVAAFYIPPVVVGIIPTIFPDWTHQRTRYRSVSTTKVINRFGVLRETITHQNGSNVSSRNLAWDSETGELLLTQTVNEYGDRYYVFNYPAHWAYEGMGQAYQNLHADLEVSVNTSSGQMTGFTGGSTLNLSDVFQAGDEVLHQDGSVWQHYWVTDNLELMDEAGQIWVPTTSSVTLEVMRSGRRNMQAINIGQLLTRVNPLDGNKDGNIDASIGFLKSGQSAVGYEVIDASIMAQSDDWPRDYCECDFDPADNPTFNPFLTNARGAWRQVGDYRYLNQNQALRDRTQSGVPHLRKDGILAQFSPYWYYDGGSEQWLHNTAHWVSTEKITHYGPYGFMLETEDALGRHTANQYNYNHTHVTANGVNAGYHEIGFDNFEEYHFDNCPNDHFSFERSLNQNLNATITEETAHTGRKAIKVPAGGELKMRKRLQSCNQ